MSPLGGLAGTYCLGLTDKDKPYFDYFVSRCRGADYSNTEQHLNKQLPPFMMDQSTATENPEPQVVFRPSKRRKQFRQRAGDSDTQTDEPTSQINTTTTTTESNGGKDKEREDVETSETEGLSVAEVLRLRNARKSKFKGVEFRPEAPTKDGASTETIPVPKDDVTEALELGMSRRFAPQAGLVGELVNKHM